MKTTTFCAALFTVFTITLALAVAACVPLYSLDNAPCPCGNGYECCGDENICVPTGQCMVCPPVAEMPAELLPQTICNCSEWLPMCVGATWTYQQFDDPSGVRMPDKTVTIVDYRDPGDGHYGKSGYHAFSLCRASSDKMKMAWLTSEWPDHSDRWQLELWYGEKKKLSSSHYYVPYKLRFDEARAATGTTWHEQYEHYQWQADDSNAVRAAVDATWSVVHWPDQIFSPRRGPWDSLVRRYSGLEVRCHHRIGTEENQPNAEVNDFCFAQGVGKIYEFTPNEQEEYLVSFHVPGCY